MNRRHVFDGAVRWAMRLVTYGTVAAVAYLLADIVWKGMPAISWAFLTEAPRKGGVEGGIFPAIVGTVYLVGLAFSVALPLGMASAIYLSEYAGQGRFTQAVRLAIITLAGVPSIVFGLFGLGLFVLFFKFGSSILAGGLTLACMALPTIIVASEEALRAVPAELRAGSLALGATKWQTICRNVLPYAVPGMITGSVLSVGRAAGETAPILLTAAAYYMPRLPKSWFDQCMALPYHLYVLATQYPPNDRVRAMQYGVALTLLALVLGINLGAIFLRAHFRRKYRW